MSAVKVAADHYVKYLYRCERCIQPKFPKRVLSFRLEATLINLPKEGNVCFLRFSLRSMASLETRSRESNLLSPEDLGDEVVKVLKYSNRIMLQFLCVTLFASFRKNAC